MKNKERDEDLVQPPPPLRELALNDRRQNIYIYIPEQKGKKIESISQKQNDDNNRK